MFGDEASGVDADQDAVEKFFPEPDVDDAFDAHVIGALSRRGALLGFVAGENTPDDMDFTSWADE